MAAAAPLSLLLLPSLPPPPPPRPRPRARHNPSISISILRLSSPLSLAAPQHNPPSLSGRRSPSGLVGARGRAPLGAAAGDMAPGASVDAAQQIAPGADGVASNIISLLFLLALLGLSLLTIGVVYLAAQDFLQKRERDKFEQEEAQRKKKDKKKRRKSSVFQGPKGFTLRPLDDSDD